MRWNQKYSREKMFDLVQEYLSSNITQSELCKREGFSRGTFKYWHRKYRSTDLKVVDSEVSLPSKTSSDFIAISVPEITEELPLLTLGRTVNYFYKGS